MCSIPLLREDSDNELTVKQKEKILHLADKFGVPQWRINFSEFTPRFDLPPGWVAGWIGSKIYVGISPEGESHT